MRIRNQVAIVTGASSGIGAAIARSLAANGVHVVLAARRTDRIESLATELAQQYGVRTLAIATDVSKRADLDALIALTIVEFQRIDILVNNAGLGLQGDVADLPEDRLRYLFDVNVFGLVNAMQAVIPYMRRQGSGVIVNVSSILGKVVVPSLGMVGSSAGYTASKFAVQAFSAAARMELAAEGIAVVTVLPGITESEFNTNFMVSNPNGERKVRKTGSLAGVKPAPQVADRIVLAIERREREVFFAWKDRLFIWGAHHFPGLFEWTMRRFRASRTGE